jgi:hypothetical protein
MGLLGAGIMHLAPFPVSQLPEGLYFYTVEANGSRATGRVVVKH